MNMGAQRTTTTVPDSEAGSSSPIRDEESDVQEDELGSDTPENDLPQELKDHFRNQYNKRNTKFTKKWMENNKNEVSMEQYNSNVLGSKRGRSGGSEKDSEAEIQKPFKDKGEAWQARKKQHRKDSNPEPSSSKALRLADRGHQKRVQRSGDRGGVRVVAEAKLQVNMSVRDMLRITQSAVNSLQSVLDAVIVDEQD
ncbi:hypothetical protein Moror_12201 [Moniliophthora roreri MCA 2997]|uniref:Uncharacterized protein n=1 Tax=Moniliophthora roreri (strain MCA 2997) TaxID=1381753 RepID=V2WL98_MONRO|nr:hypothetical protein Moror_12201 [Moniliophthora roreri MCA 2997]